jgi:hypothetical protein
MGHTRELNNRGLLLTLCVVLACMCCTEGSAQRRLVHPGKLDSGTVAWHTDGYVAKLSPSLFAGSDPAQPLKRGKVFLVFDLSQIPDTCKIAHAELRFSMDMHNYDVILFDLSSANIQNADQVFSAFVPSHAVDTITMHTVLRVDSSRQLVDLITASLGRDSLKIGLGLERDTLPIQNVRNVLLDVTYLEGGRTSIRIVHSMEGDTTTVCGGTSGRAQFEPFAELPVAWSVLMGDDVDVEIRHARCQFSEDSAFKFCYWSAPNQTSCTQRILHTGDTTNGIVVAHSERTVPADIHAEIDADTLCASFLLSDPWRTEKLDSIQIPRPGFVESRTPYAFWTDSASLGVFLNKAQENGSPTYRMKIYRCLDAQGTPKSPLLLDTWDMVFDYIEFDPPGSAQVTCTGENDSLIQYGIVFQQAGARLVLRYKWHMAPSSLTPRGLSFSNQRNVAVDYFGRKFLVYQDRGEVWHTSQIDANHWKPERRLSDGSGTAKNPSIGMQTRYLENEWSNTTYGHYVTFVERDSVKTVYLDNESTPYTIHASALQCTDDSIVTPVVSAEYHCHYLYVYTMWNDSDGLRFTSAV